MFTYHMHSLHILFLNHITSQWKHYKIAYIPYNVYRLRLIALKSCLLSRKQEIRKIKNIFASLFLSRCDSFDKIAVKDPRHTFSIEAILNIKPIQINFCLIPSFQNILSWIGRYNQCTTSWIETLGKCIVALKLLDLPSFIYLWVFSSYIPSVEITLLESWFSQRHWSAQWLVYNNFTKCFQNCCPSLDFQSITSHCPSIF